MSDFKKYYYIPAPPDEVYAAITNPISIQLWTGEPAEMLTEAGTEFSLWSGSITGKNLEFETDKKIVQVWYFGEQKEESIVTIKLHADKSGTSFELKHTNIPEADFEDIKEGWQNSYIDSLIEFFKE